MTQHQMSTVHATVVRDNSAPSPSDDLNELFDLYTEYRAQVAESLRRIGGRDAPPQFAIETSDDFSRFWQRLAPRDRTIWEKRLRSGYEKELGRIRQILATCQPIRAEGRPAA
jgi:hypothetical protein